LPATLIRNNQYLFDKVFNKILGAPVKVLAMVKARNYNELVISCKKIPPVNHYIIV